MKERIIQPKKTIADSFSIPALKQPTRGFGSQSSGASFQPLPDNSLAHDISRIPLRRPQAKLTINQPGDIYEQQADTVAQEVVGKLGQLENHASIHRQQVPQEEQLQMQPLANSITPLVQREEIPEEEEEELQMKSLDNSTLQRESAPEEEEEEEELQMKPMVQHQGKAGMAANPNLETSINQAKGNGQPMADNIREPMEQAFGADFSGVKVHTDSQSNKLNQSIQARAFTTGQDVFFKQGEYNPQSADGQELLAHELTHVLQQSGGMVQRSHYSSILHNSPPMQQTNSRHIGEIQRKPVKVEGKNDATHIDDVTGVELRQVGGGAFMVLNGRLKGAEVRYDFDEGHYYTEDEDYNPTPVELGEGRGGKEDNKEEKVELVDPNIFALRADLQEYRTVSSMESLKEILTEKANNPELKRFERERAEDTLERVTNLSKSSADSWPALEVSGQDVIQGNHRILVAIIRKEKIKVKR
ncbi:eCIS core domain-containing protein [Nostoc linckia]|uniref:eCIS core domain-containing protein n=1 Tax=Nostoc linckia TaxID=92942 RepID=UPI001C556C19|nr:DUF4157 domain-containing protein [Nostoc linckia]